MVSKFFYNYLEASIIIKQGFVYVNGKKNTNPYFQTKQGDIVQLVFNNLLSKNWLFKYNKLLKKSYGAGSVLWNYYKYINMFNKTPKKNLPDFYYKFSNIKNDIPRYIEVDFQTFSIIILHYPINKTDFNYQFFYFFNFYMSRLYNWKYIT